MIKRKYFIEQFLSEEYLHGGITGVDAERVLLSNGFESILFPYHHSFSLKAKAGRLFFLLRKLFSIKKDSVVVFISPVYAGMSMLLLNLLRRKKDIEFICFIADINGLKDQDEAVLRKEIRFFQQFRYFIVHNEKMREWVHKNISADSVAIAVEFFDFFTKPLVKQRKISLDIVFAGNLEKSTFLEDLYLLNAKDTQLRFHLYGPGQTVSMISQKNVINHGVEKPYELPPKLEGSFGLVWDGDSIDKPAGSLGNYMQYICHHKLSLYIISKLPIIVSDTAASAPLIEKYKIGFVVSSLYDIGDKINTLSPDEYRQMQTNMGPLAEKISKGQCLGNAIDEIMSELNNQ